MKTTESPSPATGKRRRFSPGIRMKLVAFLLPLVFLLVILIAETVTRITEGAIYEDLLQRGVAISRVVALSSGYSILSADRLARDSLAAETKRSAGDIEYLSIRNTEEMVLAHNLIEERGKKHAASPRVKALATFLATQAYEVVRQGKERIEFTTPIFFAGKRVGTVSLGISRASVLAAQKDIRKSIPVAAPGVLGRAPLGTLAIASFITPPLTNLSSGGKKSATGHPFTP